MPRHLATVDPLFLITEVHNRQPVWNKNDLNYHRKDLTDSLWEEIAVIIGESVPRLKMQWKNLKDTYRREAKRVSLQPGHYPKWRLYKPLMFLSDSSCSEMDISNPDEDERTSNNSILSNGYQDTEDDLVRSPNFEFATYKPETDDIKEETENSNQNENETQSNAQNTNRQDKEQQFMTSIMEIDDSDLCFFKSLIPHMKELNSQRRMFLKLKIHEMVYQEIYGNKSKDSHKLT